MHNQKARCTLIFLSFILCLIIVLKVIAGSNHVTEIKTTNDKNSNTISDIMVETSTVYSSGSETKTTEEPIDDIWPYPISQEEIDLIALVTMAEAEGETELGKRLVIDTILNRVDNPHFPDTVYDVIYYPNAFSPMWNGRIERCCVTDEIIELVKEELLERTNGVLSLFLKLRLKGEHKMKTLFSYLLSTMAGLCLVGGIAILSGGKE